MDHTPDPTPMPPLQPLIVAVPAAALGRAAGIVAAEAGAKGLLTDAAKKAALEMIEPLALQGLAQLPGPAAPVAQALFKQGLAQIPAAAPQALVGAAEAAIPAAAVGAAPAAAVAGAPAAAAPQVLAGQAAKAIAGQAAMAGMKAVVGGAGIGALVEGGVEVVAANGQYRRGDISGRQYAARVGKACAKGGVCGAVATAASFSVAALVGAPAVPVVLVGIGVATSTRLVLDRVWT
jgi:hypothetical protein